MRRNPTLSLLSLTALTAISGVNAAEAEDSLTSVIERTVPLRTHSLAAPYVDTDLQNRWWDFGGDAIINTNKHVRLTQDKPSQSGWLWARMPLSISNWQIDVEFKVDGKAHNIFGDGWAFWVTSDRAKQGPVFGSVDWFKGIGVFFDTYANSKHAYTFPRVSAMLGDGKTSYDHDRDNEGNEIGGCSENFRRRGDVPTKARLTYVKGRALQLKLQTKKSDEWKICFETNVDLPESPYIGFSAATGDVSDNHDIVSVNTYSLTLKPEYRASKSSSDSKSKSKSDGKQAAMNANTNGMSGKGRREVKSGGAGWFMFILKVIGVLAFIAFAVAASMPRIMYGTAWKKERTAELVCQAVKAGFRGIDTACQPKHYREDLVGQAIKSLISEGVVKREELYIQTKFTSVDGQDPSLTLPYDPSSPIEEQVKQSFETSLKNLGVEYVDAVVLHSPLRNREDTLKAYLTLSRFLSTKQIRHLGISNCYDPLLLKWLIDNVAEYSSKHQEEPEVRVGIVQNRWYEGNGWDWDG
ncbi:hypothetical protein LQV05_006390 [Cryptococcus neoformans]|nr:hypothetical protein LQV05_006390 [Cryptococcus neoformans]